MKTKLLSFLVLAASLGTSSLLAQNANPAGNPAASAPSTTGQTIYAARLPSPEELTNAAASQRIAVDKIDQTAERVTVTYRYSDGQTSAVTYRLLPSGNASASASAPILNSSTYPATPTSPAPVVVYQPVPETRTVYYYNDDYYPYRSYYYPPVSIGLGFGFGHYYGGGYRGGFYGGGHYGGGHYGGGHFGHR